jgi:hypothetical protein
MDTIGKPRVAIPILALLTALLAGLSIPFVPVRVRWPQ